jgi:hypothetical protein
MWANFQRIIKLFTPKICHLALKNMGLGSEIRKKPIPGPGSRGQKGTGSQIRKDRNNAFFSFRHVDYTLPYPQAKQNQAIHAIRCLHDLIRYSAQLESGEIHCDSYFFEKKMKQ